MFHKLSLAFALLIAISKATSVEAAQKAAPDQRLSQAPQEESASVRAAAFLAPYGLGNFSVHYVDALTTLLDADNRYALGDYAGAKQVLDRLWARYPTGDIAWSGLPTKPFGINIGSPPCYYALRMLSDMTDWRVSNPAVGPALRTARLTVVVVGKSHGIEPRNLQELNQGTGIQVQHELSPRILLDGAELIHQSLRLFQDYVLAMSEGALGVETRVLSLPDVDLQVTTGISSGRYFAGLVDNDEVWPHVPAEVVEETDWWWLLYPSHVPEQYPAFRNAEFITGGMGVGPQYGAPSFLIDDRWLVRKPPHIGTGDYTRIEREAYLPQWLQHEFFHHLFRTYPEFGLEATPHQWFNLSTWPPDFVGRYEPDYFHEALYKRLQDATPPLVASLRYATKGAPWSSFVIDDVLGSYRRNPVLNAWHNGSIQLGPQLEWQNQAGVDWNLQDDLLNGKLLTGPDCPYYGNWNGNKFDIVLQRDALGDLQAVIEGFVFSGELYERL